jgi:hypothetical protein
VAARITDFVEKIWAAPSVIWPSRDRQGVVADKHSEMVLDAMPGTTSTHR